MRARPASARKHSLWLEALEDRQLLHGTGLPLLASVAAVVQSPVAVVTAVTAPAPPPPAPPAPATVAPVAAVVLPPASPPAEPSEVQNPPTASANVVAAVVNTVEQAAAPVSVPAAPPAKSAPAAAPVPVLNDTLAAVVPIASPAATTTTSTPTPSVSDLPLLGDVLSTVAPVVNTVVSAAPLPAVSAAVNLGVQANVPVVGPVGVDLGVSASTAGGPTLGIQAELSAPQLPVSLPALPLGNGVQDLLNPPALLQDVVQTVASLTGVLTPAPGGTGLNLGVGVTVGQGDLLNAQANAVVAGPSAPLVGIGLNVEVSGEGSLLNVGTAVGGAGTTETTGGQSPAVPTNPPSGGGGSSERTIPSSSGTEAPTGNSGGQIAPEPVGSLSGGGASGSDGIVSPPTGLTGGASGTGSQGGVRFSPAGHGGEATPPVAHPSAPGPITAVPLTPLAAVPVVPHEPADLPAPADGMAVPQPAAPQPALLAVPVLDEGAKAAAEDALLAAAGTGDRLSLVIAWGEPVRPAATPAPELADSAGELAPLGAEPLGEATPLDAAALERALQQFLDQLADAGQAVQSWFSQFGPLAWFLIGTALAGLTQEVVRRQLRKARGARGSAAGADLPLGPEPFFLGQGE